MFFYLKVLINILYEKIHPLDYENFDSNGVRLRPRGVPCEEGSYRICEHCGLQDAFKNRCNYFDENNLDSVLFRLSQERKD